MGGAPTIVRGGSPSVSCYPELLVPEGSVRGTRTVATVPLCRLPEIVNSPSIGLRRSRMPRMPNELEVSTSLELIPMPLSAISSVIESSFMKRRARAEVAFEWRAMLVSNSCNTL